MTTPTLVIVPGLWLGPYPYQKWADETLTKMEPSLKGNIFYAPLASTGTRSPGAPNMTDDATAIRKVIQPLVEAGKKVVVIGHSSGAFLSAMSTEDLEVGQKLAVPHGGGVEKFIFIAGGLLPVGAPHPPTNWEAKDGTTAVKDVDDKVFFDVDPNFAASCKEQMKSHPLMDEWSTQCSYTGWEKVPSCYILTTEDRTISKEVQEICSGLAKCEVTSIPTGHMPFLSAPELLAEKVLACLMLQS